jgi:hypothetical protein
MEAAPAAGLRMKTLSKRFLETAIIYDLATSVTTPDFDDFLLLSGRAYDPAAAGAG